MTSSKHRYFSEKLDHKFSQFCFSYPHLPNFLPQTAKTAVSRTCRDLLLLGSPLKFLPQNMLMKGIPIEQINGALALPGFRASVLDSVIILKC